MIKRFMRKIESLGWRKSASPLPVDGGGVAQKTTPFTQITPPQQPIESRAVPAAPSQTPIQPAANPVNAIENWVKTNYSKTGSMPNLSWIKTPDLMGYLRHFIEEEFKATGRPSASPRIENIRKQVPLTPVNVLSNQVATPQVVVPIEQPAQQKQDLGPLESLPDYFNVGMDNVEDVEEKGQKKEEILTPEQQQIYKQRMESSRGFINSFLQTHGGMLQSVAGKAISFGKDPAAVEDALQAFKMNFLGPSKKFTNQDNRLVLLTKPETQAALMQVEPFASRVRGMGLNEQQMLSLAGNTQGQYQALGNLLVESRAGAHDSLPDALNNIVTQGQMPDAFRKFYLGSLNNMIKAHTASDSKQAHIMNPLKLLTDSQTLNYILGKDKKFAARLKSTGLTVDELIKLKGADDKTLNSRLRQIVDDTYPGAYDGLKSALEGLKLEDDLPEGISRYLKQSEQGGMRGTTSINQSVGSDDGAPEMGDMLGQNQRSDMAQDTNQQVAAYFGEAQKIIQGKLQPVKKMTDHIVDAFDQYVQWEGADDPRLNIASMGGAVYIPDLLQVYMNAAQQQIKKLMRPGVNKDKQDAFNKIRQDQAEQGHPMQFSTKGGRLQLIPPQSKTDLEGNPKINLEDMGLNISKLVQSQSLQTNFKQMSYIKDRIDNLVKSGMSDPEQISNRIKAEFDSRNYTLPFNISKDFVKNTIGDLNKFTVKKQVWDIMDNGINRINDIATQTAQALPNNPIAKNMPAIESSISEKLDNKAKAKAKEFYELGIRDPREMATRLQKEFRAFPEFAQRIDEKYATKAIKNPVFNIDDLHPVKTLEMLGKNGSLASEAVNEGRWKMWQSMFPFVFQMVEGYPPDVRRLFFDMLGIHRRYMEPVRDTRVMNKGRGDADLPFYTDLKNIPPQLLEGKKWFETKLDQIVNAAYPITPEMDRASIQDAQKKQQKLEKAMKGYTKPGNVENIWKWFMNEPMPPQVQEWLQWAKAHKGKERATKGYSHNGKDYQVPDAQRQARLASLLRRMWASYDRHEIRLGRLIAAKSHILKVASSNGLDDLISRAKLEAFNDLLVLSRLL